MILYGMGDPVAAITTLAPHVRQLHIKDALPSPIPGHWGQEVVVGTGSVPWGDFLSLARHRCPGARLVIEREAGNARVADVIAARSLLKSLERAPRKDTHGQA
jgi:sugar phosphate isomerase/epimerase